MEKYKQDDSNIPMMKSVVANETVNGNEYSVGAIDESMLSDEEKEKVEQISSEFDIEDVNQVIKFGIDAQRNISDFSTSILKKVKNYDLGEVGESLKELTVALDATTEKEKKGLLGLVQKAKRGVDSIRANYTKAENNVNRIEKDLQQHQSVLSNDIMMYQQMYELNVQDRAVYAWVTGLTLVAAFYDLLRTLPDHLRAVLHVNGLVDTVGKALPFATIGLGWICPAILGLVIGLIFRAVRPKKA